MTVTQHSYTAHASCVPFLLQRTFLKALFVFRHTLKACSYIKEMPVDCSLKPELCPKANSSSTGPFKKYRCTTGLLLLLAFLGAVGML